MEEIAELRHYIESGKYQDALGLLDEMEEMSRDDKMNRISSFMEILLLHLIKQAAEQRTTRSWDVAIRNSLRQIVKINKRRKAGGWYLTNEELQAALREAYDPALDSASLEAFEGKHSAEELGSMINKTEILETAFRKIAAQAESESH
ncbi:MAG TPA: DUF29 family protein [Methylomirabilota bacterium]|jgi:predicted house-cleaning noncanonical NTP pyrophosphatase (MazG superfamily)|nr:DUF29 family protein [Methylomirabilota bacterium]